MIKLIGVAQTQARLAAYVTATVHRIDKGIDKAANEVVKKAKQKVPKDTGTLKESLRKEKVGSNSYRIGAFDDSLRRTSHGIPYSFLIEYGGHHPFGRGQAQPARPFLRPAKYEVLSEVFGNPKKYF